MKNFILPVLIMLISFYSQAQRQPVIPNQLNRKDAATPKADVKPVTGPKQISASATGLKFAIVNKWKGARITQHTNSATVDSLWLDFSIDGTFSFKHQSFELNGPTAGAYTVNGNTIKMTASKFPFAHTFNGTYNGATGTLSGSFTEVQSPDPSQPAYYTAGTTTGTFNLKLY